MARASNDRSAASSFSGRTFSRIGNNSAIVGMVAPWKIKKAPCYVLSQLVVDSNLVRPVSSIITESKVPH